MEQRLIFTFVCLSHIILYIEQKTWQICTISSHLSRRQHSRHHWGLEALFGFSGIVKKGDQCPWWLCQCHCQHVSAGGYRRTRSRTLAQCHYKLAIIEKETTMVSVFGRRISIIKGIPVGTLLTWHFVWEFQSQFVTGIHFRWKFRWKTTNGTVRVTLPDLRHALMSCYNKRAYTLAKCNTQERSLYHPINQER